MQSTEEKGIILLIWGGEGIDLSKEATLHYILEGRSDSPRWRLAEGGATQKQRQRDHGVGSRSWEQCGTPLGRSEWQVNEARRLSWCQHMLLLECQAGRVGVHH